MRNDTRRVMVESLSWIGSTLAYGYSDSSHDEFDRLCDHLRHAYICEESDMNDITAPTFDEYCLSEYGETRIGG